MEPGANAMQWPDHDLLEQLIEPENDHAWKLAVGHTLRGVLFQTNRTNGRVTKLEKWMWMCIGGLAVVSAIVVPLFLREVVT